MQPAGAGTHQIVTRQLTFDRAAAVCRHYEEASGIYSTDFYALHSKGDFCSTMVNGHEATRWAAYYRAYLDLRPEADTAGEWTAPSDPSGDLISV